MEVSPKQATELVKDILLGKEVPMLHGSPGI